MVVDNERARMQADQDFIDNELEWTHWPVLPVKLVNWQPGDGGERVGILISGHGSVVFLVNIFDAHKTAISDMRRREYGTWNELLTEWMVD